MHRWRIFFISLLLHLNQNLAHINLDCDIVEFYLRAKKKKKKKKKKNQNQNLASMLVY